MLHNETLAYECGIVLNDSPSLMVAELCSLRESSAHRLLDVPANWGRFRNESLAAFMG
jgi:hypothetical protein